MRNLKKGRFLLFLFGFIVSLVTISAQSTKPRIKYLSMKDGMSQVSVNDMLLDDIGFVWIGTADGLDKYDGTHFKHYKNMPKDSSSISGNYITKIVKGHNGTLWVGTRGNGLNLYTPLKDSFKRIQLNSDQENENISGIVLQDSTSVLVSTVNNGLYQIGENNNSYTSKRYLNGHSITSLFRDSTGVTWVGTLNGKVYGFTEDFNSPIISFDLNGNIQSFHRSNNHLFIGSYEGFYAYNLETKDIKSIELEDSGNFKTMHVVDFLKEDDTCIWIATGRGLYLFDYVNFKVKDKIEYQEKTGYGLSNNTVQSLLKVSPSLLYVGTANEITCLDFKDSGFKNISKNKKGNNILNDNVIFSIYKNKNLWVGTSDGGLNLITKDKTYYYIDNNNDSRSIAGSVVRAIVHDKVNNRLWLATTRGLSMLSLENFDPNKPKFKNFYHNPLDTNSINSNFLKDLVLDSNNNLWGATHEHGIFRLEYYDNNKHKITTFISDSNNKNTLVNNEINCLEIDKNNTLWVGTQNGLSKVKYNNKTYEHIKFTNFVKRNNTIDDLPNKSINDILIDEKNQIWLGTRNGLSFLKADGTFKSWAEQNQFPNTLIYCIQDDLDGNLWLGTNDGLVKFNMNNQKFSHYSTKDNIQGREFDMHARFRDQQGNVYLGGVDGVTYFNPKDLNALDVPQQLYFSQLKIKEDYIKPKKGGQDITIDKTSTLEFNHNQFPFYLKFSSIDFRFDKNVQYAYRLLPLDEDWNILNDTEIQFLSLPVGDYILEVNGFYRGKEWVKKPLSMNLKVNPPWWFTHLAIISYAIIILLITYWVYKFQISRKLALAESERLKEIDHLKNSLYTNITHEFRTPITVILGMTETLREQSKLLANKPLDLIENNSRKLLSMVNNMLDLTKLESTEVSLDLKQADIIEFIKYIFESYESLAREKAINYTFYSEVEHLVVSFDSDKLATVITNLLVNAIKFTPERGKVITLISVIDNKSLQVKIIDSGIGMSKNEIDNIFKKFYQVEASSRNYGGTGIGLALSKELVLLMKGDIFVKSKKNTGSEFTINLPIGNQIKSTSIKTKKQIKDDKVFNLLDEKKSEDTLILDEGLPIVLIIEDNKDVAFYLKTCLEKQYQIINAEDGDSGVEKALKYIPDIIISDVMMPKKNGYEVCDILKNEIATNHIPLILLTAKSTDSDKIKGLSKGADAYLVKPFNKEELFTRLDQLVSQRKRMIAKFTNEDYKDFVKMPSKNPETLFLKNVVEIIQKEMYNQDFGTSQLAEHLNLSESQVYRKIKATTDRSVAIFIRSVRLNEAKKLIQTTNKTFSEIAYLVGFNDPSWFSRAFKEEFKQSPSDISRG